MSLYYSLIFGILVAEVGVFSILALPIPTKYRKPLTLVLLKPFKNSTVQVSIKCILAFILLLFLDSIGKVYTIEKELRHEHHQGQERIEILSRKFFQQRNMYLTGITLFLTFIVTRTFGLVNELLQLKERYRSHASIAGNKPVDKDSSAPATSKKELLAQIKAKNEEIALLKEKAESLQKDL